MEYTELIERARQRAIDQNVKVYRHDGKCVVPGISVKPGQMCEISIDPDGRASCECPGFT